MLGILVTIATTYRWGRISQSVNVSFNPLFFNLQFLLTSNFSSNLTLVPPQSYFEKRQARMSYHENSHYAGYMREILKCLLRVLRWIEILLEILSRNRFVRRLISPLPVTPDLKVAQNEIPNVFLHIVETFPRHYTKFSTAHRAILSGRRRLRRAEQMEKSPWAEQNNWKSLCAEQIPCS